MNISTQFLKNMDRFQLDATVAQLLDGLSGFAVTNRTDTMIRGFIVDATGREFSIVVTDKLALCTCGGKSLTAPCPHAAAFILAIDSQPAG
jgi:hypothetical protein